MYIYYYILRKFRTERDRSTQQPPLLGDWPPLELSVRSMNCEMMGARKIKMGPRINTCELLWENLWSSHGGEAWIESVWDVMSILGIVCNTGTWRRSRDEQGIYVKWVYLVVPMCNLDVWRRVAPDESLWYLLIVGLIQMWWLDWRFRKNLSRVMHTTQYSDIVLGVECKPLGVLRPCGNFCRIM